MLLSIESSAVTASASLTDGDNVIKSELINAGLTHSETLMPMISRVMADHSYSELDAIAVSAGPGSFTGVRIGVATAKGLAFHNDILCISVSALEAIACNFVDQDCIVCAVMDARRSQFYNAVFEIKGGSVNRLCADRAISLDALREELALLDSVIIAGDGARLCIEGLGLDNTVLADEALVYQSAVGVSRAAKNREKISASQLMPVYLRPSQAERELKLKKEKKQ